MLSDSRFENRRRALASRLAAKRIDAMLLTHLTNVRYFSGFSGSNGALLVQKDLSAQIATDGRYTTQIAQEVPDIEAKITRKVATELLSGLQGPKRVGYEAGHLSVAEFERLEKACPEDVQLIPIQEVIEDIRVRKDAVELEKLREVATLANQAFEEMLEAGELRAGVREIDVAASLEYRMRLKGAERTSFDTIVASGPNSAKPHHGASERIIQDGDIVTIDFGAFKAGFNSDTTRTVMVGTPSDFAREIYQVVLEAQRAGVAAAMPGTPTKDVDKACRDIIQAAGYGEYFVHSTGHGVGLDVHEAPSAAQNSSGELEENMTLTVEPGIYVPGKGGVRIEDTLVIRAGAPENLTNLDKELRIIEA
ncbi:M24 family metallopeptidase [Corynebacterium pelargi]|uniref:Xaa-Pro dipeptidase n=1 Tax=Corynebacterium pelargi TaxID=1471400 RepID=A0A410W8L2_9CORY|nr:aminopeptidase P family protein [Corynebacterium pelargi]QAU52293.1 Xaa-Pro dipeptidase [Corynebacterium pelargi]GGG68734.1 Xaa-Pro aminopeptidase [Corynebacterium pelargi]